MTVAEKVRELRIQQGLSQEELAHKMGLKSRSSITRIEKAGNDITLKDVERISSALNVSPLVLMGWGDESTSQKEKTHEEQFCELYSQLNPDQQKLIDNMLIALSSKR